MSGTRPRLVVTVNGPGETSGWLRPLLGAIRAGPSWDVVVVIWPCRFAAGSEDDVVRSLGDVADVVPPRESASLLFGGARRLGRPGGFLHLGGEPALTLLLARTLASPALAYAERPFWTGRFFRRVFLAHPPPGRLPSRSEVIGDLVADRVGEIRRGRRQGHGFLVALFPGSRSLHVKHLLPGFLAVAARAASSLPHVRWAVVRSPFLGLYELGRLAEEETGRVLLGESATLADGEGGPVLKCRSGLVLPVVDSDTAFRDADMALMPPGTCTAEAAAAGLPMIVVAPTPKPELVALPGPLEYLGKVPFLGLRAKRAAVRHFASRRPLLAIPNLLAGSAVVPELRGDLTVEEVASALVELACDDARRASLSRTLPELMGGSGAASRLVARLSVLVPGLSGASNFA